MLRVAFICAVAACFSVVGAIAGMTVLRSPRVVGLTLALAMGLVFLAAVLGLPATIHLRRTQSGKAKNNQQSEP
jgi:hypothetical protein